VPDARHCTRTARPCTNDARRPHDQAPGHPRAGLVYQLPSSGRNYAARRTTSSASAAKTRKESRIPATCVKCLSPADRAECRRSPGAPQWPRRDPARRPCRALRAKRPTAYATGTFRQIPPSGDAQDASSCDDWM